MHEQFTIYRSTALRSYPNFTGNAWQEVMVDKWQDGAIHAQYYADKEGYNVISAKAIPPQLDNQFIFGIAIVVEPKYPRNEVPGCLGCEGDPKAFKPNHYPMPNCRSGKYPHCTCDGCF